MFYLTTHSEHFNTVIWRESKPLHGLLFPVSINGSFMEGRKEGNVLFNDALNTFYLRLYGVRHMVKDHSDSERGNPLPLGFFCMHHPTDRIAGWLER